MHCILQCTGALHTAHANPCLDGVCVRHICGAKNVLIRFVSLGQAEYNGCNFYQVLRVCFDADIKFQLFIVLSFVSDLGPGHHGLMTDFIQLKIHSKFFSGYEVIRLILFQKRESCESTPINQQFPFTEISLSKPDSSEAEG